MYACARHIEITVLSDRHIIIAVFEYRDSVPCLFVCLRFTIPPKYQTNLTANLGPVVRSLVSAIRWLRGIKTYRFPWYLTLVSANHASSNPGLNVRENQSSGNY